MAPRRGQSRSPDTAPLRARRLPARRPPPGPGTRAARGHAPNRGLGPAPLQSQRSPTLIVLNRSAIGSLRGPAHHLGHAPTIFIIVPPAASPGALR